MGLFSLNNQEVARKVSRTVYKNLYQDIIHKEGFGITDKFITPEQTTAAMVDIYVPIPIASKFRMRGAETNGLWTNTENLVNEKGQRKHVLSKRFSIDILKRYDTNIAVSEDEVEGMNSDILIHLEKQQKILWRKAYRMPLPYRVFQLQILLNFADLQHNPYMV